MTRYFRFWQTSEGYLFKGKACAVIGGGDTAMEEALMLSRICSRVVRTILDVPKPKYVGAQNLPL